MNRSIVALVVIMTIAVIPTHAVSTPAPTAIGTGAVPVLQIDQRYRQVIMTSGIFDTAVSTSTRISGCTQSAVPLVWASVHAGTTTFWHNLLLEGGAADGCTDTKIKWEVENKTSGTWDAPTPISYGSREAFLELSKDSTHSTTINYKVNGETKFVSAAGEQNEKGGFMLETYSPAGYGDWNPMVTMASDVFLDGSGAIPVEVMRFNHGANSLNSDMCPEQGTTLTNYFFAMTGPDGNTYHPCAPGV